MKNQQNIGTIGLLVLLLMMFTFYSCSKTEDGKMTKEQKEKNTEEIVIDEKDITESDEDIATVDYKEFYDLLTPHGEWLQVRPEEIGLQPYTDLYESSRSAARSLSDLIGVKAVYADVVENNGMIYVWKPSVELAVIAVPEKEPVYVPYTNGNWVNSDAGWYFKAATPVEETVTHYGRWVNTADAGWLWVPGRVWAPAWVDWKLNDKYVAWVPLPPSVYVVNNTVNVPVIEDRNYVIVEKKYFLEPAVYKYTTTYYNGGNVSIVREMTPVEKIVVLNNTIINRGPAVNIFEVLFGKTIEPVRIVRVTNVTEVKYADREYVVYTPVFKKFKHKDNRRLVYAEPKSFKKYKDWKMIKSGDAEYNKETNEAARENNGNENGNKGNVNSGKKNSGNDNGSKNSGNDNVKKNSGNDNENKNSGNDNVKKNNGNDNGNKNKGNDPGNTNKGNDKGNKNKDNNNGNKNNGNDNGNKNKSNDNGKGKK